jgi:hypothetical protein
MQGAPGWLVPSEIRSASLRWSIPGGSVDGAVPGQLTVIAARPGRSPSELVSAALDRRLSRPMGVCHIQRVWPSACFKAVTVLRSR